VPSTQRHINDGDILGIRLPEVGIRLEEEPLVEERQVVREHHRPHILRAEDVLGLRQVEAVDRIAVAVLHTAVLRSLAEVAARTALEELHRVGEPRNLAEGVDRIAQAGHRTVGLHSLAEVDAHTQVVEHHKLQGERHSQVPEVARMVLVERHTVGELRKQAAVGQNRTRLPEPHKQVDRKRLFWTTPLLLHLD